MVFSSTTFLFAFLPLLLLAYFPIRKMWWRNGVLLVFSLIFYAWGEPIWVLGMLAVTLVNHVIALVIRPEAARGQTARRVLLAVAVVASLAMLLYFKYAAFLVNTVASLIGTTWRMAEQHMPIGISFYTFQVLTYTVDVYHGKAAPQRNYLNTLLYISCFPQLIAGPIVQYADVAEALKTRTTTAQDFSEGMGRFVLGLSKKVLLANICGQMLSATTLAGTGAELSLAGAWLSAVLYALQLFFDFSAYSDMAIGLGRVLGFTYRENFDHPYMAVSVADFWKRWHISLTSFFREYVYIPLGGNRHGSLVTARNMLVVWALTGLWHGASWNFVLWGLYYFLLQALERFVLKDRLARVPRAIRHVVTLVLVVIGWVIFYYTDLGAVGQHLLALFGLSANGGLHGIALYDEAARAVLRQYTVYPLLACACCLPLIRWMKTLFSRNGTLEKVGTVLGYVALTALLCLSVIQLLGQTYNPFIYFRF